MTGRALPPLARRLELGAWLCAAIVLAAPALAMRLTPEVSWTASDFAAMAGLLGIGLFALHGAITRVRNFSALLAAGLAIAIGFLLIVADLAVGIAGDRPHLAFIALPPLSLASAFAVRWNARPMAIVMALTAAALAVVLAAMGLAVPDAGLVLAGLFVAGWLASAALFSLASRQPDWRVPGQ